MARFLVKRIGLALITLILLSMIVFAVSSILPGNVGRAVLGPFATQESVDALNEQLGTNRSLVSQYIDWVSGILHGDLGTSLTKQVPAWDVLWPALQNSFKLAFVAFVILVPISILGGVIAGLRYGRPTDKGITMFGLSVSAMPDFVTGIVLILVFAVWLGWLPVTAQAEPGANLLVQVEVPAPARVHADARSLRLHRARHAGRDDRGVRQRLRADRVPEGAARRRVVVRKHVLRNALLPTIAVIAVQCGYLVGGLVAVEYLFNYQGLGALTLEAARQKDLPLLTAGVLVIGIVYLVVTLIADILYAFLNPRIRFGDDTA